jgi:hypothetical protein
MSKPLSNGMKHGISLSGYHCSGVQLGCTPKEKQTGCKRNLIVSLMWSASLEIGQFFVPATIGRLVHHCPLSLMVLLPCNNVSVFSSSVLWCGNSIKQKFVSLLFRLPAPRSLSPLMHLIKLQFFRVH